MPADVPNKFNVHGSVHRENILIYVQQDATLHSLFNCKLLYMFRVVPPPIIRSADNCKHSIWYVTPLLLPAAIAAGSSNSSYSCLRSWWRVVVPPETCRAVYSKINCVTLHHVGYILEYLLGYWLANICNPRLSLKATNHVSPPFITQRTTPCKYKYFPKISIKGGSVFFICKANELT